ncbi:lipoprotein [Limnohabitans sp. Rim8]|uniref:LPS translocon maturation chaperone LptM n=1 Tax=Limnohabitans sp. Rim8 TaxID=1100718 RepID=UPI0025DB8A66|nr:lipoprotein [Limnohabitans sp. Rim8]
MLKVIQILVTAHALVGGAAMLSACGQKGPLFTPNTAESAGRATLTQTLNPWRDPNAPGTPATAPLSPPAAPAATPR